MSKYINYTCIMFPNATLEIHILSKVYVQFIHSKIKLNFINLLVISKLIYLTCKKRLTWFPQHENTYLTVKEADSSERSTS